jgi:exodeoxyribonuclease-3
MLAAVKVATWNVNGVRAREAQLADFVARARPDVLCLQELKATPAQVPPRLCALEGYWCYWHGAGPYSGVGLHLRQEAFPERPQFVHPDFDHETRIVTARAGDLLVASVYVPNGGKDYAAKLRFLEAHTDRDVHVKERKPGLLGQRPEERALIDRLLAHDLVDVLRAQRPDDDALFTWWAPWRNLRQRNIGWRIDYVLASTPLAATAAGLEVAREFGTSDHAPVTVTLG